MESCGRDNEEAKGSNLGEQAGINDLFTVIDLFSIFLGD